ncbi:hypothetical protein PRIPAC_78745 [Pristionchus pacificus]|uniref:Uncharacterized protein n=1 Tax=Pristionchus pacificus TaxID=54126 RepID=A0A2A6BHF6_PRIPA|nr:hypothetical protein PRIPAC_78745 [Pristionchus pacificus]|eukprot:PDM65278.1 hypothetical protein PRIPAC_52220 [Pristionchus pacificus]
MDPCVQRSMDNGISREEKGRPEAMHKSIAESYKLENFLYVNYLDYLRSALGDVLITTIKYYAPTNVSKRFNVNFQYPFLRKIWDIAVEHSVERLILTFTSIRYTQEMRPELLADSQLEGLIKEAIQRFSYTIFVLEYHWRGRAHNGNWETAAKDLSKRLQIAAKVSRNGSDLYIEFTKQASS